MSTINKIYILHFTLSFELNVLLFALDFPGCQRTVDVALVVDTSGSVKQVNFNKVIQFLKLFVDRFDFPDSCTRSVSPV